MSAPDFWSRRRAAVAAETAAEADAEAAARRAADAHALEDRPDAEILEELGLPEPEAMETSDQVQALLRATVPQRLRTRALRRLWRLNPVLANLDGLVDYADDYTDAATVVPDLRTLYQVGRGMVSRIDEALEVAASPTDAAHDAPPEAAESPSAQEEAEPDRPEDATLVAYTPAAALDDKEPLAAPAPRRRMQFRFDPVT